MTTPPPSPCINICQLDAAGKTCTGCCRTLEEIARWSGMSDEEKSRVLTRLRSRRTGEGG